MVSIENIMAKIKNKVLLNIKKVLIEAKPKKERMAAPVSVQHQPKNPTKPKKVERIVKIEERIIFILFFVLDIDKQSAKKAFLFF